MLEDPTVAQRSSTPPPWHAENCRVFEDLDTRRQQQRHTGHVRMVLHEILITPLQQQPHPHAASGRMDQARRILRPGRK
jgi:hypothetical protein